MKTLKQLRQIVRCWFKQIELVSVEEYEELVLIKRDISFMDCSGQYDDFEERAEHFKVTPYTIKLKALKIKHDNKIRFLSYPYEFSEQFEVRLV